MLLLRRLLALVLVAAGLLGALATSHARRLGNELLADRVVIGETAEGAPDPGNDAPEGPVTFGVIGPLRGSHAALERALAHIQEDGPVDFVVLLGDVTATGSEAEAMQLAATWKAAGVEVLAVPGSGDREPARTATFEAFVSPARWWFVRNGHLFVGAPGDGGGDAEFVDQAMKAAPGGRVRVAFSEDPWFVMHPTPRLTLVSVLNEKDETVVATRVVVTSPEEHSMSHWSVSRAPTVEAVRRDAELGVLHPLVGTDDTSYAAVLAGCAVLVGFGFLLFRRRRVPAKD